MTYPSFKYNDYVFRWVVKLVSSPTPLLDDKGRVQTETIKQFGHVMDDSPEDQRGVAVWWEKYRGPREMVDKLTLTKVEE